MKFVQFTATAVEAKDKTPNRPVDAAPLAGFVPTLVVILLMLIGCDFMGRKPHVVPGPTPWIAPGKKAVRLEVNVGNLDRGYVGVPYWDEGNGPVEAKGRSRNIYESVPESLMEKLKESETRYSTGDPSEPYEWHKYTGEGTIVSLSPDIAIVTVCPRGGPDACFESWRYSTSHESLRDPLNIPNRNGAFFWVLAGTSLPYSNEMYVVSPDPGVKTGPLWMGGSRASIPFDGGRLVLTRDGDIVNVFRE